MKCHHVIEMRRRIPHRRFGQEYESMTTRSDVQTAFPRTPFVRSKTFLIEIPCFPVLKCDVRRARPILVWQIAEARATCLPYT